MSRATDKLEAIFGAALELEGAARQGYLAEACGADQPLRQEVERLLKNFERAGQFLTRGGTALESATAHETSLGSVDDAKHVPGDPLGPYLLLEKLGEGGCGIVYRAEQTAPVR